MGGAGSGKIKSSNKTLVEDCECLDVCEIVKFGFTIYPSIAFIESNSNQKYLSPYFIYGSDGQLIPSNQKIYLAKTTPHLGGKRYYFKCPMCNQRVVKLYKPPDTMSFRCKVCHQLLYQSQESKIYS